MLKECFSSRSAVAFTLAFLLVACGPSELGEKIASFEESKQEGTEVEISNLKEVGTIKCSDSLQVLFERNMTDTGLPPEAMKDWTPDSMISHYSKLVGYYKNTIGAFQYSASTNAKPQPNVNYEELTNKYKKELTDDSTRLQRLVFFNANKDSVIALKYECLVKIKTSNAASAASEINKIVAVSKDRSVVLGSSPK
jgi:hypothetical protein